MTVHPIARGTLAFLLGTIALLVGTGCLGAEGGAEAGSSSRITVADAYVPQPAGDVAAAYMTITNDGGGNDTLLGVRTEASRIAEVHETTMEGPTVSMRAVDSLEIPAGEVVALEPGRFHVMLIEPTAPLEVGDQILLVVTFEEAGDVEVLAEVVASGGMR